MTFSKRRIAFSFAVPAMILMASHDVAAQNMDNSEMAPGFVEQFGDVGFREQWWFGNFDHGGERFVTGWRRKMATVEIPVSEGSDRGGELVLALAPSKEAGEKTFFGAEAQRGGKHHYGDYEVIMKAGRGSGVISAFFTYTGPFFKDPHDEIDIEILGKDTTKMYANVFVGGKTMPGRTIPLGFDSAASFNLYRFEWRPESITWYANGREILRVTASETAIPSTPGKLFVSIWGSAPWQDAWSGPLDPATQTEARFACISYRPVGDAGPMCSDEVSQ